MNTYDKHLHDPDERVILGKARRDNDLTSRSTRNYLCEDVLGFILEKYRHSEADGRTNHLGAAPEGAEISTPRDPKL
jgi:hypothetical protein